MLGIELERRGRKEGEIERGDVQKGLACVEYFRLYLSLVAVIFGGSQRGKWTGRRKRVDATSRLLVAEPDSELVMIAFLDEVSF